MTFSIKIRNPPVYPEKEIRWENYGKYLCSIFNPYFEEVLVEYFKDTEGRLDLINVTGYKSKLKYKESEENQFFANIFRTVSQDVKSFFVGLKLEAYIDDTHVPSDPSWEDRIATTITNGQLNKSSKPAIVKTPETGKDDLIIQLGKLDPEDMQTDGVTIQIGEDGRYFVGYLSKKDGMRYYMEVPAELGAQLMKETK